MPDHSGHDDGWEDVAHSQEAGGGRSGELGASAAMASAVAGQIGGQMGGGGEMSDAMTSAMVSHFARELTKGSVSLWPQFAQAARQCFNVTHGYVLRKLVWQLVPLTTPKKKSFEGEINADKDWTVRMFEGLEVALEEPDMYIPTMGFVTYVLLIAVVQGLREQFHPDVLSNTVTFAAVLLALELAIFKGALFMAGAVNAPSIDLAALLGYKYFHLSMQVFVGLLLGHEGILFRFLCLSLAFCACLALWQSLRRLARLQPSHNQECVTDVHKVLVKALPAVQLLFFWLLLPAWPKRAAAVVSAAVVKSVAPAAPALGAAVLKAVAANVSGAA